MRRILIILAGLAAFAPAVPAQTMGWRGDGTGRFPKADPPIDKRNVAWATQLPNWSNASPVVAGNKVITLVEPATIVCCSMTDGRILWQKANPDLITGAPKHGDVGYSTPTPVTDGESVYVSIGGGSVACYDLDGNRKWGKVLEKSVVNGNNGVCASPLLIGNRLIVHLTSLMALNKVTGKVLWSTPDTPCHYGTPVHAKIKNVDVVITPHGDIVRVSDGKRAARLPKTGVEFTSPVIADGVVYFVQKGSAIAYRLPGARAESPKPRQVWAVKLRAENFFGSPVCHEGILYAISQLGWLIAIDANTGKMIYEQKLNTKNDTSPSLTLAGKYICASGEFGGSTVFEPGRQYKQVSQYDLGDRYRSSPVFVGDKMLIRARNRLFCIRK